MFPWMLNDVTNVANLWCIMRLLYTTTHHLWLSTSIINPSSSIICFKWKIKILTKLIDRYITHECRVISLVSILCDIPLDIVWEGYNIIRMRILLASFCIRIHRPQVSIRFRTYFYTILYSSHICLSTCIHYLWIVVKYFYVIVKEAKE